jgi:hypothetical protein
VSAPTFALEGDDMTKPASRFFRPGRLFLAALTLVLVTSPAAHAQSACEDQCLATYDACSQNCLWGNFYGCDETCQNNLDSCLSYCPPCPSTRTYTQTTILQAQVNVFLEGCFYTAPRNRFPKAFDNYSVQYRQRTFQETTACNGSQTTVQTGDITYVSSCWKRPLFDRDCRFGSTIGAYGSATPVCPF